MPSIATHERLLTPASTAADLFRGEKVASTIARMPDDHEKWPAHVHSELLRNVPYLSKYDIEIVIDKVEPEAGAALGYAQIRNHTVSRPQDDAAKAGNVLRIPIIIANRRLQKFMVFEAGGAVYPLNEERIEQAMLNPAPFDTSARSVPTSASLVDQLYPPYQQRQGFGRIIEPGAAGLSKISSAPTTKEAVGLGRRKEAGLDGTAQLVAGILALGAATGAAAAGEGSRGEGALLGGMTAPGGAVIGSELGRFLTRGRSSVAPAIGAGLGALGTGYAAGTALSPVNKEAASQEALDIYRSLIAHVTALFHFYYTAHWLSSGAPYYGDHQLFARLYGDAQSEIDSLSERAVGLFGDSVVADPGELHSRVSEYLTEWGHNPSRLEAALLAERQFLSRLKNLVEMLKGEGEMTLGLDDLLPAIASTHETHVYLLQQRLRPSTEKVASAVSPPSFEADMDKLSMAPLQFSRTQGLPGPTVFQGMESQPKFRTGVMPADYWFYPLMGSQFLMGIPRSHQKQLEDAKDQQERQRILMSLAYKEIEASRMGRVSPGALILVTKTGKGYRYELPMDAMGGGSPKAASVADDVYRMADEYVHGSPALKRLRRHLMMGGGAVMGGFGGAVSGAASGPAPGRDDDERRRRAIKGGLLGAATGAGIGSLGHRTIDDQLAAQALLTLAAGGGALAGTFPQREKRAGTPVMEVPKGDHPVKLEPPVKRTGPDAEFPFEGFIDFQGLKIDVENKKGSYRKGKDKDGNEWKCKMHHQKEALSPFQRAAMGAGIGGALGAGSGALAGPEGKKGRNALVGGGVGAILGGGVGLALGGRAASSRAARTMSSGKPSPVSIGQKFFRHHAPHSLHEDAYYKVPVTLQGGQVVEVVLHGGKLKGDVPLDQLLIRSAFIKGGKGSRYDMAQSLREAGGVVGSATRVQPSDILKGGFKR